MTDKGNVIIFLTDNNPLAVSVNKKANDLYLLLRNFNAVSLNIEPGLKDYFINHHLGKRLFFSIQNSAHIIYQSVKRKGKPIEEINMVDYGAGLGTLYLLGGMLNFKRMVYNDYLPDWKNTAEAICSSLNIAVDAYVTGDIDAIINYASTEGFIFDIIASRNVIEHIYDLPFFYSYVHSHNPGAVIFATTSANYHNPAMWLKHYLLHKKIEKEQYGPIRKKEIKKEWPDIKLKQLNKLNQLTRGKAGNDFRIAINDYKKNKPVKPVLFLRTNTCLPDYGLWCEHLLTKKEYEKIITKAGFKMEFSAGYWDTHYASALKNFMTEIFNKIIKVTGKKNGIILSPFVNVVAYN